MTSSAPDPADVIPRIPWTEFVDAAARYASEIRARSHQDASPGALAYTILTICRALRTVRAQIHGSKQEAAAWTRELMPEWAWLIDCALRCRRSRGTSGFDDDGTRAAAHAFIRVARDITESAAITMDP
jgi:aminoglycoside adenylyltransferase-like protein